MRIETLLKIREDKGLHAYLKEHSYWYRYLNRSDQNYNKLVDAYKIYKREQSMNKVNSTIENIEMFSNIIKFVE